MPAQVAGIVVGVHGLGVLLRGAKLDAAGGNVPRQCLADVLNRRQLGVIISQRVEGMWVGRDDPLRAGSS